MERLETLHIYWTEVLPLLNDGWTLEFLREKSVYEEAKFNVLAIHPKGEIAKLVIDHKSSSVQPFLLSDTAGLTMLATHTKTKSIQFPLAAADEHQAPDNVAEIGYKPAKPNLRYTITYDGAAVTAVRNTPMAFLSLNETLKYAYDLGAATAILPIPKSVRQFFQTNFQRARIVEKAFKEADIHMSQWARSKKFNWTRFNKSIVRGDNYPECRKAISEFVGRSEDELWPEIAWNDIDR